LSPAHNKQRYNQRLRWDELQRRANARRHVVDEENLRRAACSEVLKKVIRDVEKREKKRLKDEEKSARAADKARARDEQKQLRDQEKRERELHERVVDVTADKDKLFALELLEYRVRLLAGLLAEHAELDMEGYHREADRTDERKQRQAAKVRPATVIEKPVPRSRKRHLSDVGSIGSSGGRGSASKRPATADATAAPSARRQGVREQTPPGMQYCFCHRPYEEGEEYVGCDGCNNWFHFDCVGVDRAAAALSDAPWFCPDCKKVRHVCADNDTPTMVAEALDVEVDALVLLNRSSLPLLSPTSRVKGGTVLFVPGRDPELDKRLLAAAVSPQQSRREPKPRVPKIRKPKSEKRRQPMQGSGSKSFLCELCSKPFASMYHLNRHLKVHAKRAAGGFDDEDGAASASGQSGAAGSPDVELKLIARALLSHKCAGPFSEPVTESIAPGYVLPQHPLVRLASHTVLRLFTFSTFCS